MHISFSIRQLPYYFYILFLEDVTLCFNLILMFEIGGNPLMRLKWRGTVAVTANLSYQFD